MVEDREKVFEAAALRGRFLAPRARRTCRTGRRTLRRTFLIYIGFARSRLTTYDDTYDTLVQNKSLLIEILICNLSKCTSYVRLYSLEYIYENLLVFGRKMW